MGQKTNPIGLRVAVNHDWRSKWYAGKKEFGKLLTEDRIIRTLLKKKLDAVAETGAELLVTDCPGCVLQLKGGMDQRGGKVKVMHIAEAVAEAKKDAG